MFLCNRRFGSDAGGFRRFGGGLRDLRQSEVEDLRVPPLGHENIRRLNVAMDNALRVRRVEGIGDFDAER